MEVSFPTDSDGFLSQECPSCEQIFKALIGQGSDQPISCCPYCGHRGENCWFTKPQVAHMQAVATNAVLGPELKKFERQIKSASKGFLKFDVKTQLPAVTSPPMETDDDLDIFHFPCCDETIKASRQDNIFCIICGMEINMNSNDAKKVFLSHKGVDKALVIGFKNTLALLGYAPWIDEDAMPAGTSLERGILKGMQDSCGVVFFITPSFKDEGYLETEINYAIKEKREKKDRFAIITLQFQDDGKVGEIPELLKPYVWKKPRTPLEALQEIIRALPITTGLVDWRDGIDGVVKLPTNKSTSTPLSDEAIAILVAAVNGGGRVHHTRYLGGEEIGAGGKSLIPNKEPRTIALWIGGLEDLQRRRYIRDLGHKKEVFEVTREGHLAADQLRQSM